MSGEADDGRFCCTCNLWVVSRRVLAGEIKDGVCVWCPEEAPPWLLDYVQPMNSDEGNNCPVWEAKAP
jgi:hypothetical protein